MYIYSRDHYQAPAKTNSKFSLQFIVTIILYTFATYK